jgi:chemotaxis protein CheD
VTTTAETLFTRTPTLTVDISDMKISSQPGDVIVTYSLGSCVGVTVYDPVACVGGMVHCMLPLSKIDPARAQARPCMFVDTGVPALLHGLFRLGAAKKNLVVRVAGAGSPLGREQVFKIGQRNYTVLRKLLWKNGILIQGEDVGGASARTLYLDIASGRTIMKADGREVEL